MGRWQCVILLCLLSAAGFALAQDNETGLSFARKAISFDHPLAGAGEALRVFGTDTDALIVRTRNNEANHYIHLFSAQSLLSDQPEPTQTVSVPKNAIFYTLGEMPDGTQEKLLIFTEKGISAYNPQTNAFAPLVNTRSLFRQGTDLRFQRSGFAQDINDDQRFDLLVQDFDGLNIFLQRPDGSFSEPLLIPVEPELRLTGAFSNDNISDTEFSAPAARTPTFKIFPSYIADATGDEKSDLIFLVGRELKIFKQISPYRFSTEPSTISFPFKVRGNTWRDEILSAEQNTDQSSFDETTVYRVLDMNADGALDVVTVSNQASGLLDRNQVFHIYFGTITGEKLSYRSAPDQVFDFGGIGGVGFRDVNNDTHKDFVVTSTALNIGKIISFLINRKITTRTRYYLDDGSGTFTEAKAFRRNRTFKLDLSKGQTLAPPFDYADFDGDGALDLMETSSNGRMQFLAGGASDTFDRKLGEIRDDFPNEGWLVSTQDINNDGKADIVVRYNQFGLDGIETSNRLVLHLSEDTRD